MPSGFTWILLAGALVSSSAAANQTIQRDVIVIGAGAAGVSAALELQRQGVSFAVVEKKAAFGGQTETYFVPGTNATIDYGVEGYTPLVNGSYDIVENFFGQFDLAVEYIHESESGSGSTRHFDLRTATELSNFTYSTNLTAYAVQAEKYAYLGYQTHTPEPIPEDFSLTFGDFIQKYSLQSSVYNMFYNIEGLGDVLSLPAFYVLRELNVAHLISLDPSSKGLAVTTAQNNQEAYLRAQAQFGRNAFVNSTVQSAQRDSSGVSLKVNTPTGLVTMKASKLLVAMPPVSSNMKPFSFDSSESGLFDKFTWSGYYAAVVNATGLNATVGFQNAASDTLYNLPPLPAIYDIRSTGVTDLVLIRYGTAGSSSAEVIKADIVETVERLRRQVTGRTDLPSVEVLAFADHLPFNIHVSASDIKSGFYNDLAALQGHRNTWYSGSVFFGASSSDIWNATLGVVNSMLAA